MPLSPGRLHPPSPSAESKESSAKFGVFPKKQSSFFILFLCFCFAFLVFYRFYLLVCMIRGLPILPRLALNLVNSPDQAGIKAVSHHTFFKIKNKLTEEFLIKIINLNSEG